MGMRTAIQGTLARLLPALAVIASAGHAAIAPATPGSDIAFLGLKNGSLIESIAFQAVWLKNHPDEDAIVIPREASEGGRTTVAAFVAYTRRGAVFARSPEWGALRLPLVRPTDFCAPDRVVAAVASATSGRPVRPDVPDGDPEVQIRRAYAALHDHDIMGYFPVAISALPTRIRKPGAPASKVNLDWLVFDWNDRHYGYHPNLGAVVQATPVDPDTGRPFVCIPAGDLVESAIFCAEYRRAHPDEEAALLFRPHDPRRGENTGGTAAAAFTRRGELLIHSVYLGDVALFEGGRRLAPGDIGDPARVFGDYQRFLWHRFSSAYLNKHGALPDSQSLAADGRMMAEILGTVVPQGLAGDTAELQVRRAYQRAQSLGISSEVAAPLKSNGGPPRQPRLVLCWNVSEYVYEPARGAHYAREIDPAALADRLIDAVLFTTAYRRDHPGERAIAIPYRVSGSSKWKAVAAYSRGGAVWLHNPEIGESAVPGYLPADLDNPAKFKDLRLDANRVVSQLAVVRANARSAALNQLPIDRIVDPAALDPESIFAKLDAAGLKPRLVREAPERDPTGTSHANSAPSVTFDWWGVAYTYGRGHYCTASDGFVIRP
jgi:hypothetical protein